MEPNPTRWVLNGYADRGVPTPMCLTGLALALPRIAAVTVANFLVTVQSRYARIHRDVGICAKDHRGYICLRPRPPSRVPPAWEAHRYGLRNPFP